jgi:hypothetical protein
MILWNPHTLTFTFEVSEMPASEGVQKILGFSRGWHHWNSVRLGIRKENDYCALYSYVYRNGVRRITRIGTVDIGEVVDVELKWDDNISVVAGYRFNTIKIPLIYNPIGYLLNSYFETDAPENKVIPFSPKIWDVRVNGKEV